MKQMPEPSLFTKAQLKGCKKPPTTPEENFFNNFQIKIKDQTYNFKPWDEIQEQQIEEEINGIKNLIADYNTEFKNKRYSRFPYKKLKDRLKLALEVFFNKFNLFIDFDPDLELEERRKNNPKTPEEQAAKKQKFLEEHNVASIEDPGERKILEIMANIYSTIRPDNRLIEDVKADELAIRNEIRKEITDYMFNKFFPNYDENDKNNQKWTIIKQIKHFISTLEKTINKL